MKPLLAAFLIVLFSQAALPAFVQKPALKQVASGVEISFSVASSIDVEVAILNANGKIVRHLAAGVLGGVSAPPAPLSAGLSQTLVWNGLDDYGNYPVAPPFNVRVRLGVSPKFERRIHYRDSAYIIPSRFAAWDYTGGGNVGWGPDTSIDTTELITPQSPVMRTGHYAINSTTGCGLWDGGVTNIDLTVSKENDDVLLQKARDVATSTRTLLLVNGLTGARKKVWTYGGANFSEPVMDWFGRFYLVDRGYNPCSPDLRRFTPDGVAMNFSWGTNIIDLPTYTNDGVRQQGFCNDQYGNLYKGHYQADTSEHINMVVSKWDSVGVSLNSHLLRINTNVQGIRVDLQGNIFVAVKMKPLTDTVPKPVRPFLQGGWNDRAPFSQAAIADEAYGSIVKFGPEGGSILTDPAGQHYKLSFWYNKPYSPAQNRLTVNGARWVHFGSSFVFLKSPANNLNVCGCYNPRFDVDRFGRVIYPDPMNNSVKALDNSGNELFRVHNRDLFNVVRMGTVVQVQATDNRIYLGDNINNQIVALSWKADVETLIVMPPGMAREDGANLDRTVGLTAFPAPFHVALNIGYRMAYASHVTVSIFDPLGRAVRIIKGWRPAGEHVESFNLNGMAAGVYAVRLVFNGRTLEKKAVLVR